MKLKILVIGGNRYFGKKLVQQLVGAGHEVTVINRGHELSPTGVELMKCDRGDVPTLKRLVEGRTWDVIYDQICLSANHATIATEILVPKTKKYILTSTMSVYEFKGNLVESDFDPQNYSFLKMVDPAEDYAVAKRQVEAIFSREELPMTFVRFPIVLGLDDYTKRLHFHIERINDEREIFFSNLLAKISFIHSDDAASILFKMCEMKPQGPINVASTEPIALNVLIQKIETAVRKNLKINQEMNDCSPFGINDDWYLNVSKAEKLGLIAAPIDSWLDPLILKIAKNFLSH